MLTLSNVNSLNTLLLGFSYYVGRRWLLSGVQPGLPIYIAGQFSKKYHQINAWESDLLDDFLSNSMRSDQFTIVHRTQTTTPTIVILVDPLDLH